MHDDPLSRVESFSDVALGGSSASSGGMRDKPGTLQAGQGRLHEGGGCPVNRGREKGRKAPSRARGWRLAAPHLLSGPFSATCRAALVRPVKSGPRVICRSHRTCGLGQSNGVVSWAHAASPGREGLGRRHRRGKVWLGQGSRRAREKPDEPARPIKLRQRETRADLTRRRGLRLDGSWGIKKQALPLPAHSQRFVSFRLARPGGG